MTEQQRDELAAAEVRMMCDWLRSIQPGYDGCVTGHKLSLQAASMLESQARRVADLERELAARFARAANPASVGREIPRKPTEAMVRAGARLVDDVPVTTVWRVMYDAAIPATEQDEGKPK
jgi:hypothetical protein